MKFYETKIIHKSITAIKSITGELLYLIQGEREAVLIDSYLGIGHLKNLVEGLTQKPVAVLLTHGHVDHAAGAVEFETVYLNKRDWGLYQRHCKLEERKGYLQMALGERYTRIKEEDFVRDDPDKRFYELKEGMVFDLGGIHIKIFEFPGHTKGSVIFLIPEYQILILGDSCNNSTFLFDQDSSTVLEYFSQLKRIHHLLEGRYQRVFQSHHVMETGTDILFNMIELCEEILAGTADDQPFAFMGLQAYIAKACDEQFKRTDKKSGNLIYRKEKVR